MRKKLGPKATSEHRESFGSIIPRIEWQLHAHPNKDGRTKRQGEEEMMKGSAPFMLSTRCLGEVVTGKDDSRLSFFSAFFFVELCWIVW